MQWAVSYLDCDHQHVFYGYVSGSMEWDRFYTYIDLGHPVGDLADFSSIFFVVKDFIKRRTFLFYVGTSAISKAAVWQSDRSFCLRSYFICFRKSDQRCCSGRGLYLVACKCTDSGCNIACTYFLFSGSVCPTVRIRWRDPSGLHPRFSGK